jgi:hypothetical protein
MEGCLFLLNNYLAAASHFPLFFLPSFCLLAETQVFLGKLKFSKGRRLLGSRYINIILHVSQVHVWIPLNHGSPNIMPIIFLTELTYRSL